MAVIVTVAAAGMALAAYVQFIKGAGLAAFIFYR
jgi:hypothetical protein